MTQVYCCDNMPAMREKYSQLILELAQKHGLQVAIKTFTNGEQLLFALEDDPNAPQVIYMDTYLGGINGLETARRLRQMRCHAEVIFLTDSEKDVYDSFDVAPLYYILKDKISPEKFETIFLKAVEISSHRPQEYFACECCRVKKKIPYRAIHYFEVRNRIITVNYGYGETFDFYATLESLEPELEEKGFKRCHRSFMVNLKAVTQISVSEITLAEGGILPLGGVYAKEFAAALGRYPVDVNR